MNAVDLSLLAVTLPRSILTAWWAIVIACGVVCHVRMMRRYRRLLRRTDAELRRLERRLAEHEREVDAEIARMRADVDAYGVWSDANDRFFHHGLVAVSHLLGARALPARRACATERRRTQGRRAAASTWRPVPARAPNVGAAPAASRHPAIQVQRRSCE